LEWNARKRSATGELKIKELDKSQRKMPSKGGVVKGRDKTKPQGASSKSAQLKTRPNQPGIDEGRKLIPIKGKSRVGRGAVVDHTRRGGRA